METKIFLLLQIMWQTPPHGELHGRRWCFLPAPSKPWQEGCLSSNRHQSFTASTAFLASYLKGSAVAGTSTPSPLGPWLDTIWQFPSLRSKENLSAAELKSHTLYMQKVNRPERDKCSLRTGSLKDSSADLLESSVQTLFFFLNKLNT